MQFNTERIWKSRVDKRKGVLWESVVNIYLEVLYSEGDGIARQKRNTNSENISNSLYLKSGIDRSFYWHLVECFFIIYAIEISTYY